MPLTYQDCKELQEEGFYKINNKRTNKNLQKLVKKCNDNFQQIFEMAQHPIRHFILGDFDEANKDKIIKTNHV